MSSTTTSAEDSLLTDVDNAEEKRKIANIFSDEDRLITESIFFVCFCGITGLLGSAANIINIIVFYKQGFSSTVNIAFFGLSISDLCCLTSLVWASVCMNPLLPMFGVPWIGVEVMYVSAAWPHICFCRITSYITVYITAERCLCIALPLKVKELVTPQRTTTIVCVIYVMNLLFLLPECTTSNLGWRFTPERNRTLLAITFTSSRKSVEGICFILHSMISMSSFFGVIIFTIVLINKLRQSSKLRSEITSGQIQIGSMSARDKKMVKMIILIASILIMCYIPGAMIAMTTFVVGSEFNIQGQYINICSSLWAIACFCQSINSSINIFLYYRMSSKYKQTLDELYRTITLYCSCKKVKSV